LQENLDALATDEISTVLSNIKSWRKWPALAPEKITFGGAIGNIFLENAELFHGSLSSPGFRYSIHHLFHDCYLGLDPQLA